MHSVTAIHLLRSHKIAFLDSHPAWSYMFSEEGTPPGECSHLTYPLPLFNFVCSFRDPPHLFSANVIIVWRLNKNYKLRKFNLGNCNKRNNVKILLMLTLSAPIPENVQTHSNNSSAFSRRIV